MNIKYLVTCSCTVVFIGCSTAPQIVKTPLPLVAEPTTPVAVVPEPTKDIIPELKIAKPLAQQVTVNIGGEKGFRLVGAQIELPINPCNEKSYVENYKAAYLSFWNSGLKPLIRKYKTEALLNPKNTIAKDNFSLFDNKNMTNVSAKLPSVAKDCVNETKIARLKGEEAAKENLRALVESAKPIERR